ncbi:hypothetical protein KUTeg_002310 [Tegillarca granosa]|uniref:Neurabin-1 n=1 Tax=Tegillarca granosa TaxID=220873 RepID=A0ABQ9FTZ4_TEGGR|nr:hypothetical protein KUTeg_002310 [Tegillarca granosa]
MSAVRSRSDVLAASRYRSGSLLDEQENNPPSHISHKSGDENSHPSADLKSRSFKSVTNDNGRLTSDMSAAAKFGSNVSKMKELFQPGNTGSGRRMDKIELTKPHSMHHTPPEIEKSPEVKRKKTTDRNRKSQPLSPSHSEQNLLSATSHVERFNYTRALFAKLEEQNKTIDPVHVRVRGRSPAAGGTGGSSGALSPALSPHSSSPTSPERRKDDGVHSSLDFPKRNRSSSESSENQLDDDRSSYSRRSRADQRPTSISLKKSTVESSVPKTGFNLYSNAPSGLLYKRRQNEALSHSITQKDSAVRKQLSSDNSVIGSTSSRRLSREEIQAALDRANTYLSHVGDSNNFQAKRRSWEIREQKSDYSDSGRGGLNKLKHERISRSEEVLDDPASFVNSNASRSTGVISSKSLENISSQERVHSSQVPQYSSKFMSNATKTDKSQADKSPGSKKPPISSKPKIIPKPTPIPRRNAPPPPMPSHPTKIVSNDSDTEPAVAEPPLDNLSELPPPPPYPIPDEPPPPYQRLPDITSSQAALEKLLDDDLQKVEEPPSPAPQPGIVEEKIESSHYENISAIRMRHEGDHTDSKVKSNSSSDNMAPPSPVRRMVENLSSTEATQMVRTGSRSGVYIGNKSRDISDVKLPEDADIPPREAGDGHEEPDSILGSEYDQDSYTVKEDELEFFEIEGLSSGDDSEDDANISYKPASKVKFSKGPIRVFATYSTEDYDRRNEDVDPVAASAEYELEKRVEKMEVFPVEIEKGPEGLGLSIIGMGVNDQIIEVDGKSLVGVTQAYAASVLRNTSGTVRFLIGREKDPSKSEVARLIQQSLEQDRRREEMRKREHERLQVLQDQIRPRDEVMEHEHIKRLSMSSENANELDEDKDIDESEEMEEESTSDSEEEEGDFGQIMETEESAAGEATPLSMPSGVDSADNSIGSPEEESKPSIEVFDLQESSSESISPDMESQALFIKLKEAQYKNSVAEAELAKVKGKVILMESVENQKKDLEKKVEVMAQRLRELEKTQESDRKEMNQYKDLLEGSQGQYIALEKRMKADVVALEKKYHKAKKLIKEYQQREKDFLQERESMLQQQAEKNQQYDALVKSLKDRLESELGNAQQAAGLPIQLPKDASLHKAETELMVKTAAQPVKSSVIDEKPKLHQQVSDALSVSSDSTEIDDVIVKPDVNQAESNLNDVVPETELLDTSANRTKGQLASAGVMAARRPPTKRNKSLEGEDGTENETKIENESGLETWIKHDRRDSQSETASTVSQSSYDPSAPNFKNMASEIPDSISTDTAGTTDDTGSTGGASNSSGTKITSGKAASTISDISSSYMVQEYDDEDGKKTVFSLNISGTPAAEDKHTTPSRRNINQFQSGAITDWNNENVCHWLIALELDKYIPVFTDKNITGTQLLQLDGTKLKTMGISSAKDRDLLKRKIKEIKVAMEKEKKLLDKERKAKEKEQKKQKKK